MMIRIFFTVLLALNMFQIAGAAEPTGIKQAYVQWIDDNSDKTVTRVDATAIVEQVHKYSEKANVDPLLVLAIIKAESGYRQKAKNPAGSSGLMQVVPKIHRKKIAGRNIFDIATNIEVGISILSACLDRFNNDIRKGLGCYSGGAGKKYLNNIRNAHRGLMRADLVWRFKKEMPIQQPQRWRMVSAALCDRCG